ncbi:unnamed protein product [Prorocentrum cordatum]|uniref:Uncharacterized protein n=1 Tax=Prorocentrum cordatum TaxID=2364126 RepID=A0ABN9VX29_9DINO|nr:unnamed protein product [Polarella glacialis]
MVSQGRWSVAQSARRRPARGACRVLGASLLLLAGRRLWHPPQHFAVPRATAGPSGPRAPGLAGGAALAPVRPAGQPRWVLAAADGADLQRQRSSLLDYGRAAWTSICTALWGPPGPPEREEGDEVSSSSVLANVWASVCTALWGPPDRSESDEVSSSSSSSSVLANVWASVCTALWGPPSRLERKDNDEVSSSVLASLMDGLEDLHARIDGVNATIMGVLKDAQSGIAVMSSQIGSSLGALQEPKDLYLFVKNYDWSLRYRVRRVAADLDVDTPLELKWVKLRKAPKEPAEVLEDPAASDLFDWTETAPAGHKGFMYEVTKAVGSGVEAVINFFKGRGLNMIVSLDGISLAPPQAAARPRPVTHCWVDVAGLPFFPKVRAINFFNSQESVLAWQA